MLNHGIIGNERILALVSPDQSIDWLCMPRFDSPSVFARLLDGQNGGCFQILESLGDADRTFAYVENTNILRSQILNEQQGYELLDFAPRIVEGLGVQSPVEIVRILRPIRGRPRLRVVFDARPDYGKTKPAVALSGESIVIRGRT